MTACNTHRSARALKDGYIRTSARHRGCTTLETASCVERLAMSELERLLAAVVDESMHKNHQLKAVVRAA